MLEVRKRNALWIQSMSYILLWQNQRRHIWEICSRNVENPQDRMNGNQRMRRHIRKSHISSLQGQHTVSRTYARWASLWSFILSPPWSSTSHKKCIFSQKQQIMSAQHVVVPLNRHSDILKDEDLLLGLLQPTFYSISTTSRSSMCFHHDPDLVWKALVPQYPVFSATGGWGVLSEDSKSTSFSCTRRLLWVWCA